MGNNREKEYLLAFLRAALMREVRDLSRSLVPWDGIMELANEQGVLGLMYDGYSVYAKKTDLQMPLKDKINVYGNVKLVESRYKTQVAVVEKLARLYRDNGIKTMILKGIDLSRLYPVPEHRQCSDVDIFLYGEQRRADKLIEEQWGVNICKDHHHHTEFVLDGVFVENHYDFINVQTHSSSPEIERVLKTLAYQTSGEALKVGDVNVYGMSPTFGALFMLRHTAQHFAAKHIELRHLVDWLLFTKAYGHNIDWKLVKTVAIKSGMNRYFEAFNRLSMSLVEDVALNDIEKRIMSDIWEPYFRGEGPDNMWFKARRWWANRWKNQLVYKESLVNQVYTLLRSRFVKAEG